MYENCNKIIFIWQRSGVLSGPASFGTPWDNERPRFNPHWGTEFFQIANCHLFDAVLYLVANVFSKLQAHEDIRSSCRGECDSKQVSLVILWLWCSPKQIFLPFFGHIKCNITILIIFMKCEHCFLSNKHVIILNQNVLRLKQNLVSSWIPCMK